MISPNDFRRLAATAASFLLLTACAESGDPVAVDDLASVHTIEGAMISSGPTLVECPTNAEESVTGTIKANGGTLSLRKHELALPPLAVSSPRSFRVATPVSNYMELEVKAGGLDSFSFTRAGTITIDYSRCTRSNVDKAPLSVWQIDPETKELVEYMGGVDDKEARTVTFQTDHLSTFSIAH